MRTEDQTAGGGPKADTEAYGIPGLPDRLRPSDRLRIFGAYHADRLPKEAVADLDRMADEWDDEVEAAAPTAPTSPRGGQGQGERGIIETVGSSAPAQGEAAGAVELDPSDRASPASPQAPDIAGLGALRVGGPGTTPAEVAARLAAVAPTHTDLAAATPSEIHEFCERTHQANVADGTIDRLRDKLAAVAPAREDGVAREAVARIIWEKVFHNIGRAYETLLPCPEGSIGASWVAGCRSAADAILALICPTGQVRTGASGERERRDEDGFVCEYDPGAHAPGDTYTVLWDKGTRWVTITRHGMIVAGESPYAGRNAYATTWEGLLALAAPPSPDTRPRLADTVPSGLDGGREDRS